MAQTILRDYLQQTEDALSAGRINDALANCQHILTHFPDSLEAQRLLGEVYLAQGNLDQAQHTFDWVLTNDPENIVAYCDRALISERMADFDTALDCYQQAYELSRGNSHIRQEFNQLSAKVGQPGFMFSRAGLARLYMRGDLLAQALQEWDTVLAASPDRLDARIGLLEVYWREGLSDQVEQLARQILDEIPTCLKTLLLLANVIFARDPVQAQELIRRTEALDPEMVMAHELFSDLKARQPADPFLALLKKEPVVLPAGERSVGAGVERSGVGTLASPSVTLKDVDPTTMPIIEKTAPRTNGTHSALAPTPDPLFGWSSLDTVLEPEKNYPEQPQYSMWGSAQETWNIPDTLRPTAETQTENEPTLTSWQVHQAVNREEVGRATSEDQGNSEQQSWYHPEHPVGAGAVGSGVGDPRSPSVPLSSVDIWKAQSPEADLPAPPAWLDTLTHKEQQARPPTAPLPFASQTPQQAKPTAPLPFASQTPQQAKPPTAPLPFASEDSEDMGWPEWLKSLGATEMDSESVPESLVPAIELSEPPQQSPWMESRTSTFTQQASPAWMDQIAESTAQQAPPTWMDQMADSFSQQAPPTWAGQMAEPPAQQASPAWMDQMAEPPAQQAPPAWMEPFTQQTPPAWADQIVEPVPQQASPAWASQMAQPVFSPEPQLLPTMENLEQDLHAQGFVELPPGALSAIAQNMQEPTLSSALAQLASFTPAQPIRPVPPSSGLNVPPGPAINESPMLPSYHADALLENELEMTMKRPAVRLQPIQRTPVLQSQLPPIGKGGPAERIASSNAAEGNLNHRERLLRGYQSQLAGDYDNAMQEYRIIIRGTPELLGDVISNVRALLKLTPKFSAGYRVLGDAYMRQGEYLQAMEAYNKALTMTKKAKGQG